MQGVDTDSVNCSELSDICSLFMRLNPRNPAIVGDAWLMTQWFSIVDLRANWPDHHKTTTDHCGAVIKQV